MRLYLLTVLLSMVCLPAFSKAANDSTLKEPKWFIVLPLRFTQLQNHNTMLSGIKLGRSLNKYFNVSVSVYHSFYLNSFKAKAGLPNFEKQPLLYINCVALEGEYYFFQKNKLKAGLQVLMGWGFINYELKDKNFKARQVNYLAVEPTLHLDYQLGPNTALGFGIGYRPLLTQKQIVYSSSVSIGEVPLHKNLPNGLNLQLSIKGAF